MRSGTYQISKTANLELLENVPGDLAAGLWLDFLLLLPERLAVSHLMNLVIISLKTDSFAVYAIKVRIFG